MIRLTVNRDDGPDEVAEKCFEIMRQFGLTVTVEAEGEDSSDYTISQQGTNSACGKQTSHGLSHGGSDIALP